MAVSGVLCPFQRKQVRAEKSFRFQDQEGTRSLPRRGFLKNQKLTEQEGKWIILGGVDSVPPQILVGVRHPGL